MDETRNTERTDNVPLDANANHQNQEHTPEFSPREPSRGPVGTMLALVALFALLVVVALYLYGSQIRNSETLEVMQETGDENVSESTDAQVEGGADDLDTLEGELEALGDFEEIGTELENSFEAEFGE
jgi:hypothetical protein